MIFFMRAVKIARLETKHDRNTNNNAKNQDKRNRSLAWDEEGFVIRW
jgi:hypothetical protein